MSEPRRSPAAAEPAPRRGPSPAGRAVALVALAVTVAFALGAGEALLTLRELRVVSGDPSLAREVARKLVIPPRANLLTTPIADFARQAEECPRVARATVDRRLPDRLILTVYPRTPLLAVSGRGKYLLVDSEGVCLYWCVKPSRELLRVTGWAPAEAEVGRRLGDPWFERCRDIALVLRQCRKPGPWVLDAGNPPELAVVSASGTRGVVGLDGDTTTRVKLFTEVLQELEARGRQVGRMELRTRRPIWWPKDGQVADSAGPHA